MLLAISNVSVQRVPKKACFYSVVYLKILICYNVIMLHLF